MTTLNTLQSEHVPLRIKVFHPIERTDNFSMVSNISNKIVLDIDMSCDYNLESTPPLLDIDNIWSNQLHELQQEQPL